MDLYDLLQCFENVPNVEEGGEEDVNTTSVPFFPPIILYDTVSMRWECSNCDLTFPLQSQIEEHVKSHGKIDATTTSTTTTSAETLLPSPSVSESYTSANTDGNVGLEEILPIANYEDVEEILERPSVPKPSPSNQESAFCTNWSNKNSSNSNITTYQYQYPLEGSKPRRGRPRKNPEGKVSAKNLLQCLDCGTVVKGAYALQAHRRNHLKKRPFKCTLCGSKFWREDALAFHLQNHVDENKKKKCQYCGKAFSAGYLATHERIHSKPFFCKNCGTSFARKSSLQMHINKMHTTAEQKKLATRISTCPWSTAAETPHDGGRQGEVSSDERIRQQSELSSDSSVKPVLSQESAHVFLNVPPPTTTMPHSSSSTMCGSIEGSIPSHLPENIAEDNHPLVTKEGAHRLCVMRYCYRCDICKNGYYKLKAFQDHIKKCHGAQIASENGQQIISEAQVINQDEAKKAPKRISEVHCKLCSLKLPSEEVLLEHLMDLHSEQFLIDGEFYYCHLCEIKFTRKCSFQSHLKLQHMSERQDSENCNMSGSGGDAEDEITVVNVVQYPGLGGPPVKIELDDSFASENAEFVATTTGGLGINEAVEYFDCRLCNKVFHTIKALRIHERMIHGDILASKVHCRKDKRSPKRKTKTWSQNSIAEYQYCKQIIDDLKKKLSCAEKLIKKTVTKCRNKGSSRRSNSSSAWGCKVTPSGIRIFSKDIKNRKCHRSSNSVIGYKTAKKGRETERGSKKNNIYECIVCGRRVSSVSILKRHVMGEHADIFDTNENLQTKKMQHREDQCVEVLSPNVTVDFGNRNESQQNCADQGHGSIESVPVPLIDLTEDEEGDELGVLGEQINEGMVSNAHEEDMNQLVSLEGVQPRSRSPKSVNVELLDIASPEMSPIVQLGLDKSAVQELNGPVQSTGMLPNTESIEDGIQGESICTSTLQVESIEIVSSAEEQQVKTEVPRSRTLKISCQKTETNEQVPKPVKVIDANRDVLQGRELRVYLVRVDDDDFDFSELAHLTKLC